MKGIVLETNDREAAVLFDNGTVSKITNRHYEKGQVVNMNNKFKFIAKAGSIAAALVITTATGFAYTTPSTYVSLDVNPSIEYKLNAFDRVISVVAVNEDGEKIVNELDVNNEKIEKAILKTVEKLKDEGFLTDEDYSGIVIAVSNKSEEKSEKISEEIEKELNVDNNEEDLVDEETEDKDDEDKDKEETGDIEISVEAVGRERVEEARKLNVTPGKLNLVQKLLASTDEFDDIDEEQLKELLNLSVKEINKTTQAYKKGLDVEFAFEDVVNDDLNEEDIDKDEANEDNDEKDEIDKANKNKDKNKATKERSEDANDDSDEVEEKDDEDDINDDLDIEEDDEDEESEDNSNDNNKPVKEEKENKEKNNNYKASVKEKNN